MKAGLSIVVPLYNEANGLARLHAQLAEVARKLAETRDLSVEVVYADDGSRTETVIRYVLRPPHGKSGGARKTAPEIASETVTEYAPPVGHVGVDPRSPQSRERSVVYRCGDVRVRHRLVMKKVECTDGVRCVVRDVPAAGCPPFTLPPRIGPLEGPS